MVCVRSGKEVAAGLLRRGQHVVLTCRSAERCQTVLTPGKCKTYFEQDAYCWTPVAAALSAPLSQRLASTSNIALHV